MRRATDGEGGAKLLTFDMSHARLKRDRTKLDVGATGTILLFTGVQYRRAPDSAETASAPHSAPTSDHQLGA